jgi:hypothetical protein
LLILKGVGGGPRNSGPHDCGASGSRVMKWYSNGGFTSRRCSYIDVPGRQAGLIHEPSVVCSRSGVASIALDMDVLCVFIRQYH